jgi:hypothetical protein
MRGDIAAAALRAPGRARGERVAFVLMLAFFALAPAAIYPVFLM